MPKRWQPVATWAVVLAVVGVAFAAGSGAFDGHTAGAANIYQRTMQVAGQYRCPVCQGETVAASDAPAAIEIKGLIREWLEEGRSASQVRGYLVADYGQSVLEKPQASGMGIVVWLLPVLVVGVAGAGLGIGFRRWRRSAVRFPVPLAGTPPPAPAPTASPGPAVPPVALAPPVALVPPVALAPPPSSGDPLAADQPASSAAPAEARPLALRWQRYQRAVLVAGVSLLLIAAGMWWADRLSASRQAGGTVAGGEVNVSSAGPGESTTTELQQASTLASSDPVAALALYDEVLADDPDQPVALTAEGWLYAAAGFEARGMDLLAKAQASSPGYGPAHFYRGLVLLDYEGQPAAAARELAWYLSHGPVPSLAAPAKKALAEAEAQARRKGAGAAGGKSQGRAR